MSNKCRISMPLPAIGVCLWLAGLCGTAALSGAESGTPLDFERDVQPVLKTYCYDCHADGVEKGQVVFDRFATVTELKSQRGLWLSVLKNLQAGLMPPEKKPRPNTDEIRRVEAWITRDVFGLDPANPDPGKVTVRRLNRFEYRNTIRDLTGYTIKIEDELPPDDTGYGFDNIGDVLTLSPMLIEKYMQLAERVANAAVPRVRRVPAEVSLVGSEFKKAEGKGTGDRMNVYEAARVHRTWEAPTTGTYKLLFDIEVLGQFNFDPGKCRLQLSVGNRSVWTNEFGWQNGKKFNFEVEEHWERGPQALSFQLDPLTPIEQKTNSFDVRISSVRLRGPLEEPHWVRPKNHEKFFWQDPPGSREERDAYGREVLTQFTRKAFRRPPSEKTVDRLFDIASQTWATPDKSFEDGIAQALVPVLASPRFLFRVESTEVADASAKFPRIDEQALATRLSYFLWSTQPDDELSGLADRGQLRKQLGTQVRRMLADKRSDALIENFIGQWLQVRDVEGIDINARVVQARDRGQDKELNQRNQRFQELIKIPDDQRTDEQKSEIEQLRARRRAEADKMPPAELDGDLRRALRDETQMAFGHVIREDRDVIELIDSDYTFLNERLAKHYGITNVSGSAMRRVSLPPDSPRGGVLTHGSVLVVTSNPTRTSPVKRGLFILDNILGTPAPPAPANVPSLEDAEKELGNRQPTLRETLEFHRQKPLCFSCHNRMDPLGLALENFNALGVWRDAERGHPINPGGKLITGESFQNIQELKRTLATRHRTDFYRCLTEKLLTYALGRGLEYYDVATVESIVSQLQNHQGKFSSLLTGIIESAPFQRTRTSAKDRAGN